VAPSPACLVAPCMQFLPNITVHWPTIPPWMPDLRRQRYASLRKMKLPPAAVCRPMSISSSRNVSR